GLVIPTGLFTIGLGFILMKFGSAATQASWLTMAPGCVLAGVGLGLTNTPVTNTTTGSVPSDRAGMASGIDMSARMISLAVNIAIMGFILVSGVLAHLESALPATLDATYLRSLAESNRRRQHRFCSRAIRVSHPPGACPRLWMGDALWRGWRLGARWHQLPYLPLSSTSAG